MKERLVYQCEYCPGGTAPVTKTAAAMYKHENSCHFNPKNKTCLSCGKAGNANLMKDYGGSWFDCGHRPDGNMYEKPQMEPLLSLEDVERYNTAAQKLKEDMLVRYGGLEIVKNCTGWIQK